jgi:4-diphosphocytidyl-2-C-methyl-D-erythritol kinase
LANRAWELNWPIEQLAPIAAEIGSDVPFFLYGGPALCFGRGERVTRYSKVPRRWFVIVKPPTGISTAEVYKSHDRLSEYANRQDPLDVMTAAAAYGTNGILNAGRWMFNRLQPAAAAVSPWVERLQNAFGRLGFLGHQLSGSGSAYFGVCRHAQHARRLATILRNQQLGLVYVTRSIA